MDYVSDCKSKLNDSIHLFYTIKLVGNQIIQEINFNYHEKH